MRDQPKIMATGLDRGATSRYQPVWPVTTPPEPGRAAQPAFPA